MICDAGVIWNRTPRATFSPFRSPAAIRRSSMRAFVQEPRKATSIFVPSTSSTGFRFAGFEGHANLKPVEDVEGTKIDVAFLGSCTNASTGFRFAGFEGHATCGPMPSTSKENVFEKAASSSEANLKP